MSTLLAINPMNETAGSVAKRNSVELKDCTPNCPPDCPDCGQVNFKKLDKDVYESYADTRKKKRNAALLTGLGILIAGAGAVFGLGKLHNAKCIAGLKDGWFKNSLESVTRGCNNVCNFVAEKSITIWNWIKEKWPWGKKA